MNIERDCGTLGHLFDMLLGPVGHDELEVAEFFGIGVEPLRARLKDLQRRGVLAGPFRDAAGVKWKLPFSTGVEARSAARKVGLHPGESIILVDSLWTGLGREMMRAATSMSERLGRWLSPRSP